MSDWRNLLLIAILAVASFGTGYVAKDRQGGSGCECSDKGCECDSDEVIRLLKDIHGHVGHGHGQVGAAP